jgi:energy-coupling factor transport system permease protein
MLQVIEKSRTPLSGLDPRLKLFWIVSSTLVGMIFIDFAILILTLLSIFMTAIWGRVLHFLLKQLKGFWLITIIIGLIQCLTVGGETMFTIVPRFVPILGGLGSVSREGVLSGILSMLRLLVLTFPIFTVIATTSTSDLINALSWFGLPFDYSLMLTLAFNFMPVYISDMNRVLDAMRVRAYSQIERGFIGRIRGFSVALIPIALNAVERADMVGAALEMRGSRSNKRKTEFDAWKIGDFVFLTYAVLVLVLPLARFLAWTD